MPNLLQIYSQYFKPGYDQIQHVPQGFMEGDFALESGCLIINYIAFNKHYQTLKHSLEGDENGFCCEMMLALNGENGKAWNRKTEILLSNKLDLNRQLRVNAAICLRCRKSTCCYEYRLRVLKQIIKQEKREDVLCTLKKIIKNENTVVIKILQRLKRNYFCWMYRNKLLKMILESQQEIKKEDKKMLVMEEVKLMMGYISNNPNDCSALDYLSHFIKRNNIQTIFMKEWAKEILQFCQIGYNDSSSYRQFIKFVEKLQIDKKQGN